MLYLSSDYVLPLLRGEAGAGVYAASKLVAEQLVLDADQGRHRVARAAFVTEQQTRKWGWVDGYSLACRVWAEDLVPMLVDWIAQAAQADGPQMVHLGDAPCTLEHLLRSRFPDHPALRNVIYSPAELRAIGRGLRPEKTVW